MIILDTDNSKSTLFQEGLLEDSLSKAADIDVDKIKSDWKDADKSLNDKLTTLNNDGLNKAGDVADSINKFAGKHQVSAKSIIARARNSVLQFPVYVSHTCRVEAAHTIAKSFERVYTTLVQTVLSQNQILSDKEANNLVFLKQYHTNLKEAADVLTNKYYEAIDDFDQMMCDSIFYTQKLTENCKVEFRVVPCDNQDIILENARLLNDPLSGFIYLREDGNKDKSKDNAGDDKKKEEKKDRTKGGTIDRTDETTVRNTPLSERDLRDMAINRTDFTASEKKLINSNNSEIKSDVQNSLAGRDPKMIEEILRNRMEEKEEVEEKLEDSIAKLKQDIKAGKVNGVSFNNGRFLSQDIVNKATERPAMKKPDKPVARAADAPHVLKDSDIKKINGLLPYTIEASFLINNGKGIEREVRYILGIKCVMHLIRMRDLADDLRELITGDVKSLQKVRYKTGEISFKDYFFNIKGLKSDAAKHINYDKRWINTLKRLADYKNMNGALMKKPVESLAGGSVPIPNGTMVLTQPDVTTLINDTGIDLSVVSNAKKLARNLFLIAIVIVDSSAGTMRVLFPDSDNEWDVQSLAAIDAEVAKTDNSQIMKELNRMVNR